MLLALALAGCTENSLVVFEGVDVYYQTPPAEVDILLVVDDSCSMSPYQEALSVHFDSFVRFLDASEAQWHIGVTSTDVMENRGELDDFIRWDEEDAADRFVAAVNVGTEGSGYEMGLEAAKLTLEVDATGFIRPEASFTAIFVSDEEDGSPLAVVEYLRAFEELKGARSRDIVNTSALVTLDADSCLEDHSERGERYIHAAETSGGVVGDLCSDDLSPIVREMGLTASRLQERFALSDLPAVATLEVSLDEELVPCTEGRWAYELADGVAYVVFDRDALPDPGQQVALRYQLGNGDAAGFCPEGTG